MLAAVRSRFGRLMVFAAVRGRFACLMMLMAGGHGLDARADDKPLWELGLGVGAVAFEDYRGSATTHAYPLPVPYIIYRGEFLQADRDGVRGKLFNQDQLEINVSGNLTTPVRNDRERSGMPELHTTLEAGPSFDFHLFKSTDAKYKLDLRMPLRAALAVESSPRWIGGTFTPRGAAFIDSPLVQRRSYWSAGIGFAWMISQSSRLVHVPD